MAEYFSIISKCLAYIWMQERDVVLRAAVEENNPYPFRDCPWQGKARQGKAEEQGEMQCQGRKPEDEEKAEG